MATSAAAVPICARCGAQSPTGDLLNLAVRGELVGVCQRCFFLEQIGDLTAALPIGDPCRDLVEEGLRTIYEVVTSRSRELAAASGHHASASRR